EPWLRSQIAQRGLGDSVELVGRAEGAAKQAWLAGCRFLVMPSRQETFGLAALEAMAASRPVLASDIDHLSELVGPGWGERVARGDVAALAARAAHLWREPAYARTLGAEGRRRAQDYRWEAIARRQLAIYEDVVARERAA